jgi:hypothetical protein
MTKLSDGSNSTLGRWYDLSVKIFGADSRQVAFLLKKINESPNGRDEEVIANENQFLYVFSTL